MKNIRYAGWEIMIYGGGYRLPFGHYQGITFKTLEGAKKAIDSQNRMNDEAIKATYNKLKKENPQGNFIEPK